MNEFQRNSQGQCSKEEYFKIFMKIGMILRPGIEADDLQRIIKEDFELDSMDKMVVKEEDKDDVNKQERTQQEYEQQPQKSYDYLDAEKLYDALFTLADTWCPSIQDEEYKHKKIDFWNDVYDFDMTNIQKWVLREPIISNLDEN